MSVNIYGNHVLTELMCFCFCFFPIQVSSNCTSFAVHDEFLLLTTHAHTLRCISLLPTTRGGSQSLRHCETLLLQLIIERQRQQSQLLGTKAKI